MSENKSEDWKAFCKVTKVNKVFVLFGLYILLKFIYFALLLFELLGIFIPELGINNYKRISSIPKESYLINNPENHYGKIVYCIVILTLGDPHQKVLMQPTKII